MEPPVAVASNVLDLCNHVLYLATIGTVDLHNIRNKWRKKLNIVRGLTHSRVSPAILLSSNIIEMCFLDDCYID